MKSLRRELSTSLKGDETFFLWKEIRHAKLVPYRLPGRGLEEIFALKYSFDLSGPLCDFVYDGRYDLEEIKTVEHLVEENGINLEVVSLTEAALKNMRRSYSSGEMGYVIRILSRCDESFDREVIEKGERLCK